MSEIWCKLIKLRLVPLFYQTRGPRQLQYNQGLSYPQEINYIKVYFIFYNEVKCELEMVCVYDDDDNNNNNNNSDSNNNNNILINIQIER